jgi:hypothetical protein
MDSNQPAALQYNRSGSFITKWIGEIGIKIGFCKIQNEPRRELYSNRCRQYCATGALLLQKLQEEFFYNTDVWFSI